MAIGKASDFQIYDEQFFSGMTEVVQQNLALFNAQSRNAIRLVPRRHRGDYIQESFVKEISSLISRRDTTSVGSATDLAMTQGEEKMVKLNRTIGPVAQTLDALRKIQINQNTFSFMLGQQIAPAVTQNMLNAGINAVEAALSGQAAVNYDATDGTLAYADLVEGLNKFGDQAVKILAWVMHSKVANDLLKASVAGNVSNIADVAIFRAEIGGFNRPIIITDSSDLVTAGTTTTYSTLGLVADSTVVMQSEDQDIVSDIVTGLDNLVVRIQGEFSYTIGLQGLTWAGSANPTDANLGTSGNWTKVASDDKSLPGIRITSQ